MLGLKKTIGDSNVIVFHTIEQHSSKQNIKTDLLETDNN